MSTTVVGLWLGLAVTAAADGALLYGGWLVARRYWADARASVRLAAAATIAVAMALAVFYVTAAFGMFSSGAVLGGSALLAAACHALWGRREGGGREAQAIAGWWRTVLRSRGALFLLGAGLLLVFAAYRAATRPPLSWDSLVYHDYFAGAWVQEGGLVSFQFPRAIEVAAHIPIHFEALVAWAMLPFHSDFLINFVNFPFLALAALAVYGLCRELDVAVLDSSLAAGLVCLSPALFAYVCTQYSDVMVTALLCTAAWFAVRCIKQASWPDCALGFLACGLAIGAKLSAIPPAGLLGLILVWAMARGRASAWRRAASAALVGLALVACAGGYAYARNWVATGNPLYPAGVRLGGKVIFPGAPAVALAVARLPHGDWRDDVRQLGRSASYMYGGQPTPLTWGPKIPCLALLALAALVLGWRGPARHSLRCLALAWLIPAAVFYLDTSEVALVARRFWHESSCRFLGPSVGLMAASALAGLSLVTWDRARAAIRAVLCAFLLYDLCVMCIIPESPNVLLAAGLAAALVVGSLVVVPRSAWRRPGALVLAPALVLAAALGAWGIHALRDGWRNRFLETRLDLHPFPRDWVKGWAFCDDPHEAKTIALASYGADFGHHWFFYPLMGRRLQNRVVYVAPDPAKGAVAHGLDLGAWKAGLEQAGVTHVFVQLDPELPLDDRRREPVELGWIGEHPERFELADSGDHYRVYRILSLDVLPP